MNNEVIKVNVIKYVKLSILQLALLSSCEFNTKFKTEITIKNKDIIINSDNLDKKEFVTYELKYKYSDSITPDMKKLDINIPNREVLKDPNR